MSVKLKIAYNQFYAVSGMTFNWTTLFVKVKNIAYAKQVDLYYSPYGSSGWQVKSLAFSENFGNYDLFGTDSSGVLSHVETFALRYRVAGQEFWDNNGGANYHINSLFNGVVGGNVRLGNARAVRRWEGGGGSTYDTGKFEGEILVNNLAYRKRVGLHYTRDGGRTWHAVEASYHGPVKAVAANVSGVEIWKFQTPQYNIDTTSDVYRFAVFFEVPDWGMTYWDNNFGQDYFLSKADGAELK